MSDDEYLKVIHGHVEHLCGGHAEGFEDAVGGPLIRTGWECECIGNDVGVEAYGLNTLLARLLMLFLKLYPLSFRGQWGDALAADGADGVA